jgi:sensor histidine kinase YesM
VDLSEILRHSLEASRQVKALLAKELVVVDRYLGLMKIQMQHRLEYSIQAADVPEHVLVPPMIIQMLAENAIKHGVEQVKEGGRVDINCTLEAGKLCIEVKNSTASAVFESVNTETMVTTVSANGKGLGLANIRNRLSLLYGDNAQLTMSRKDSDFVVRIVLPVEEAA